MTKTAAGTPCASWPYITVDNKIDGCLSLVLVDISPISNAPSRKSKTAPGLRASRHSNLARSRVDLAGRFAGEHGQRRVLQNFPDRPRRDGRPPGV